MKRVTFIHCGLQSRGKDKFKIRGGERNGFPTKIISFIRVPGQLPGIRNLIIMFRIRRCDVEGN